MMDLLVVLNFYLNAVMFRGQAFFCACSIYLPRQNSVAFEIKGVYLDSVSIAVKKNRGDGMIGKIVCEPGVPLRLDLQS
jgi:hypothetical protein